MSPDKINNYNELMHRYAETSLAFTKKTMYYASDSYGISKRLPSI